MCLKGCSKVTAFYFLCLGSLIRVTFISLQFYKQNKISEFLGRILRGIKGWNFLFLAKCKYVHKLFALGVQVLDMDKNKINLKLTESGFFVSSYVYFCAIQQFIKTKKYIWVFEVEIWKALKVRISCSCLNSSIYANYLLLDSWYRYILSMTCI